LEEMASTLDTVNFKMFSVKKERLTDPAGNHRVLFIVKCNQLFFTKN
jgi:hypothetical protein